MPGGIGGVKYIPENARDPLPATLLTAAMENKYLFSGSSVRYAVRSLDADFPLLYLVKRKLFEETACTNSREKVNLIDDDSSTPAEMPVIFPSEKRPSIESNDEEEVLGA
jgi:hypothetical protein